MDGTELKQLGQDLAALINDADKLGHGGGIIPALWNAVGPIKDLAQADFVAIKQEVLDPAKRQDAEGALVAALDLTDKALQAKLQASPQILESVVDLAEKMIADFKAGEAVVDAVKAILK